MKIAFLLFLVTFICCESVFAQNPNKPIEINEYAPSRLKQNGKKLTYMELFKVYKNCPEARAENRRARGLGAAGTLTGVVGTGLLLRNLAVNKIFPRKYDYNPFSQAGIDERELKSKQDNVIGGIGISMVVTCVMFNIGKRKHKIKSAEVFNNFLKSKDEHWMDINLKMNANGLGMTINF